MASVELGGGRLAGRSLELGRQSVSLGAHLIWNEDGVLVHEVIVRRWICIGRQKSTGNSQEGATLHGAPPPEGPSLAASFVL